MRIDPNNFYTITERNATTLQFLKGLVKAHEIPFNLLPESTQLLHMDNLKAFLPTACHHCNQLDETAFLQVGVKSCQHCGKDTGYVPIANLPSVDIIKARVWKLCKQDLEWVNANNTGVGWLGIWELYLKAREL